MASTMMNNRTYGRSRPANVPCMLTEPLSQWGATTSTPIGPNKLRAPCCRIKLIPHVAKSVSNGLPYNRRITITSSNTPNKNVPPNATAKATRNPPGPGRTRQAR